MLTLTPDPNIFYNGFYTAPDDWFDTRNTAIKTALYQVAQWVGKYSSKRTNTCCFDGYTNNVDAVWHQAMNAAHHHALHQTMLNITTSTAGTSSVYVHPLTTISTGTTTNYVFDLVDCDPNVYGKARMTMQEWAAIQKVHGIRRAPSGLQLVRSKNHRGDPLRSFESATLFEGANREEITALHLLRSMVEQEQFRHYLKHGFITVRGDSGLDYQIQRNDYIKVRERGEVLATLCVHLRLENRPAPPTDHVVGKMLIVQCDELEIWKRGNARWETKDRKRESLRIVGQYSEDPVVEESLNISNGGLLSVTGNTLTPQIMHYVHAMQSKMQKLQKVHQKLQLDQLQKAVG